MITLDTKANLIAAVVAQVHANFPTENGNLDLFVNHFFKRVSLEYLQKMLITEWVEIVQEAWKLFQARKSQESLVKIKEYNLSHHMVPRLGIFMVNLDQPFLIDSITNFLEKNDYKIELSVHPVLGVHRTHEGKLVSVVDLKEIHSLNNTNVKISNNRDKLSRKTPDMSRNFKARDSNNSNDPESIAFIQIKSNLKRKQIEHLEVEIDKLINQVRSVVFDWPSMRNQLNILQTHIAHLPTKESLPSSVEPQDLIDLLIWLERGHFVFLGARYFPVSVVEVKKNKQKNNSSILCLETQPNSLQLGLFRNESVADRDELVPVFCRTQVMLDKSSSVLTKLPNYSVAKTSVRSMVHRPSRIDSLEFIDCNSNGQPVGIYQFIGIFTKIAFTGSAFETPIVGRKVQRVFDQFGLAPQWHDGKTLVNIINSIPRDELFYLTEEQIYTLCQNVLNLSDQRSLALSIRQDVYGRYATVIVFLHKDRYSIALKGRMNKILEHHLKGKISSYNVLFGDLDYARLIFVVSFSEPYFATFNQADLEKAFLEASLTWEDHLESLITNRYDEENTSILLGRYQKAFPATYVDEFTPEQALKDITYIETISDARPIDLYLYKDTHHKNLKVKIFHVHRSLSLSTLLPILQNLGLQVMGETSYSLEKDGFLVWIHDFEIDSSNLLNWKVNQTNIISAFHHIWNGSAENDTLYQLILKVGLNVSQVTVVRAYLKFLRQVQLPYSLLYLEETLTHYSNITRNFVDLFELRFSLKQTRANNAEISHVLKEIHDQLESVDRLDHDRILRRVLNAIESTVRTNYFQNLSTASHEKNELKQYIAFKFDCRKLEDLPHPAPLYEIFIYSPRVEATHMRGAKVARGGIRWSDRPEDFRTEILGLMKAQTVKNAVIVPLGSKGGFVIKNQAKFTDRDQLLKEVVSCYQIMIRGMLDLTDNIVKGKIVHPPDVVEYDDDDPYLVVAADKGTSEFSDIANAISNEYAFWLGDAFASGGSEGYDHKKMAITARGAWESVKRHFREIKHDCQNTPFTVVGVGDMSGDVFGNGMLQSPKICLLGAFNHQHIFLDPNPNTEMSFKERKRLFDLPRSSWKDYNPSHISNGGGVFDRSAKSIQLSRECQKAFGISQSEITPDDLIKCLLSLPVDLLYFGGIGTFVKSSAETHADVGDRANNDVRVNGKDIRGKIIGEGANLAMTQRGRIEYALAGGRLNTDAIDNSGGVDCSDHEVNLKILFSTLGRKISNDERNLLLREMTNEVAQLVLMDNYRQTQILSVMEEAKSMDLNAYQALIRSLENEIKLDRSLEALPDDEVLEQRRSRNQGMTRPELSVLLAYSKISLYGKILNSSLPDAICYQPWFYGYFPKILRQKFEKTLNNHPLRREITATVLTNEVINRVGPVFIYEISQTCGVSDIEVVKAFFLAAEILELKKLWDQIDSLDRFTLSEVQTQVLREINQSLEQIILWFLRHPDIKQKSFTNIHNVSSQLPEKLYGDQQHIFNLRKEAFIHFGITSNIAHDFAMISFLPAVLDIMYLGKKHHNSAYVAKVYFSLQSKIGLDWLTIQAAQLHADAEWQRSARTILIDDLAQIQVKLTNRVLVENKDTDVEDWLQTHRDQIHHIRPILATIKSAGHTDLGMLSYAMHQLERLV